MKLQTLRGEFESLRMNDSKSISDCFDWIQIIVNQMRFNGKKLDDQRIVEKIMWSLSTKFNYVVVTIEEENDIFTLTIEGLMSSFYLHE